MKAASKFFFIISILLQGGFVFSQAVGDYRSAATGSWATVGTWQTWNGVSWVAAGTVPLATTNVTIQSGHTVTMNGNPGDCLSLTVNGTATWSSALRTTNVGAGGLIISGGTVTGTAAGTCNVSGGCTVSGTSTLGGITISITGAASITGTLTISSTAGTKTFGDITISGTLTNSANEDVTINGNFTNNGTFTNSTGLYTFSGGANATISGTGSISFSGITVNKSTATNTLTLSSPITVSGVFTFTTGILVTSSTNYPTVNSTGSVLGASNSSFISGPIRYTGTSAFTYPVGKGSDYQALGVTATSGTTTFWTEAFSNGCAAGCSANGSNTGNGAWTVVSTGTNGTTPNTWYISCAEDGCNAGGCGVGCAGNGGCPANDPSLHVAPDASLQSDMGASYVSDACLPGCLACDLLAICYDPTANQRAESPTINCTGQSTITLAFNYIENGQTTLDDATVWYYDGTSWSQIDNPPKVVLCSGQGTWTARSIALPASANNNPNVKIGFNWTNNADALGTDPSFAVDDITLSAPALVDFTCEYFYANPITTFGSTLGAGLAQIENCEYWILTRNAGTASKNVTLNWDANSCFTAPVVLSNTRVARWDGAVWQSEGNTANTGAIPPSAGSVTSASVSNFSPFTIGANITWPLPVELLFFTAKYNGKTVDLKWSTASEENSDYFTIERSDDGKNFSAVGKVKAAGNNSTTLNYSSEDKEPLDGISYYRLRETDFDGKEMVSPTVAVNIKDENGLAIENIFSAGEFTDIVIACNCSNGFATEIIDMTGKKMYWYNTAQSAGETVIRIKTSDFAQGVYLAKVSNGYKTRTRKFVILK